MSEVKQDTGPTTEDLLLRLGDLDSAVRSRSREVGKASAILRQIAKEQQSATLQAALLGLSKRVDDEVDALYLESARARRGLGILPVTKESE